MSVHDDEIRLLRQQHVNHFFHRLLFNPLPLNWEDIEDLDTAFEYLEYGQAANPTPYSLEQLRERYAEAKR